jgi:hypothetical protein
MKLVKHFVLINRHRWKVLILCTKCGLFWRGLVHDLSKFSPTEFFRGVKYYVGDRSSIDIERRNLGYSLAWLHHIRRNKHHFQYWMDPECEGYTSLPYKYAVENFCDVIAASKVYKKKEYADGAPLTHWLKYRDNVPTNEKMKCFYDKLFTDLKEKGEKYVLNKRYLKETYQNIIVYNSNL